MEIWQKAHGTWKWKQFLKHYFAISHFSRILCEFYEFYDRSVVDLQVCNFSANIYVNVRVQDRNDEFIHVQKATCIRIIIFDLCVQEW